MVKTEIRVIYGDTDQMGVVYYANYLRYFEAGRNELIRAQGMRYRDFEEENGLRLPVVQAHVDYREPARYDDLLTVETSVLEVGRASVRFQYQVLRDGSVLAQGHTIHACIDEQGKVRRVPDKVAALLMQQQPPRPGESPPQFPSK